ncbi:MAG: ribosome recycling factor, partial [Coriobacteriales bacterium]|nr:ribosome recycling factor [Coriobacteriales bacterium]
MPIQDIIAKHTQTMDHAIEHLHGEFAKLRTGRANPNILEQIKVDYYGQPTPINQVGSVKSPDAHMLTIEPWDKGMLKGVEKALIDSDLGVTPQNDGKLIRLAFPQPTEERRKELAKDAKK